MVELSEQFELPQLYSLNDAWVPEFVYRSRRAWPQFFIPIDSAIEGVASVPDAIAYQNLIDDVAVGSEIYVDTSTFIDGDDEPFRISAPLDATALTTGLHDVTTRVTGVYPQSRISLLVPTRLSVINAVNSPFGARLESGRSGPADP